MIHTFLLSREHACREPGWNVNKRFSVIVRDCSHMACTHAHTSFPVSWVNNPFCMLTERTLQRSTRVLFACSVPDSLNMIWQKSRAAQIHWTKVRICYILYMQRESSTNHNSNECHHRICSFARSPDYIQLNVRLQVRQSTDGVLLQKSQCIGVDLHMGTEHTERSTSVSYASA